VVCQIKRRFPENIFFELNFKSFLRFFAKIARSSIPPTALSGHERDPQPSEAQRLISTIDNLQTAFQIYRTLIQNQKPTVGVFKNLFIACLDLGQPRRAKDIWKGMKNHSVAPNYWCFKLSAQICGKTEYSLLGKALFSKIKNEERWKIQWMCWNGLENTESNQTQYYMYPEVMQGSCNWKAIHERILSSQTELVTNLETALLNMYAKCGNMMKLTLYLKICNQRMLSRGMQ
jgi:hypothetical protein